MTIETWVTGPAGASDYRAHLDRSPASPFRAFAVSRTRGADPGTGSLEHHLDNALLAEMPTLLADGNLVWMRYRGRTLVWVIEERRASIHEGEHASDWVQVSGRGVKQLLGDRTVWPTAFSESSLDPAAWGQDSQWRRFVGRAAGEMLWDLIHESNPRFATPFTRGVIETGGADGWTQDFRFDTLLDVVGDVAAAYGDVDLDGLRLHYRSDPGVDRTATVIFEEGADVLRVERLTSDRDTVTWAVAEGVGEGVTAKLAVASDPAVPRRREAYLDAKDAGNLPLVQLRADAAIGELAKADSIALEVSEDRFAALTDYDVWDTIRVIAPSRGIDETGVIVALYLGEDEARGVRVGIDVNTPRQEALLRLEEGNRSVRRSVSVRNRQPQGQLVPFSFSGADVFDDTDTMDVFLAVPDRMYVTIEVSARLRFREFFASAKSASSGGGATSGGGAVPHRHIWASSSGAASGGYALRKYFDDNGTLFDLGVNAVTSPLVTSDPTGSPTHTHSTPDHTHGLTYGVFKEAYPASHSVTLKVYELQGGSWVLVTTIAALTADFETIDLTPYITGPGDWRLELKSDAAQPNGGRLGCDVYGFALGAIQSS